MCLRSLPLRSIFATTIVIAYPPLGGQEHEARGEQPVLKHGHFVPQHIFVTEELALSGIIDFGEFQGSAPIPNLAYLVLEQPDLPMTPLLAGYDDTVRLAVVIDEFSYAVDADSALPSILQRLWDTVRQSPSQAFVVLRTSFTEAVERHFQLDGPLYRRRTRDLRLAPFTNREATLFFPHWPRLECLLVWGIVGGIPSYLRDLREQTWQLLFRR